MDAQTMMQMMAGLKPQDVSRAVGDLKGGRYKNADVLTGDASGAGLGGILKIVPGMMKNGTKMLTKVSTMDDVPRWLLEMDGAKMISKAATVNPATISDMGKKVTGAPSAKSVWDTVDKLAAKGKGRKIVYHVKKGREPL